MTTILQIGADTVATGQITQSPAPLQAPPELPIPASMPVPASFTPIKTQEDIQHFRVGLMQRELRI
ncbi:hypothetical protein COB11_08185 [Candidatus Aerophobetes bacterium]|uniref:Uncharacterized protein n=1 Tax=Aerophobetes bacterium TaxID=2030807 RepID=A0A2A4YAA9_UNCAE|nr:MAG: hypothetical protein COB11_08185 [Candidatus Aerophobetes bacterium]